MQFDAKCRKTTREVQPCPPCPAPPPCPSNNGGPAGAVVGIVVLLPAVVGLFALIRLLA